MTNHRLEPAVSRVRERVNFFRVLLTSNCASMAPPPRPSFSATIESLKACWSSWAGS